MNLLTENELNLEKLSSVCIGICGECCAMARGAAARTRSMVRSPTGLSKLPSPFLIKMVTVCLRRLCGELYTHCPASTILNWSRVSDVYI